MRRPCDLIKFNSTPRSKQGEGLKAKARRRRGPGAVLQRTLDGGDACSVNATLETTPGSNLQALRLSIRHEDIRKNFGRVQDRVSPLYGSMLTIDFRVGMVLVPAANSEAYNGGTPANNIIIFDSFSIVANTFDQVAIVKQSSYSIATHVAFWTAKSQQDANVRLRTTVLKCKSC